MKLIKEDIHDVQFLEEGESEKNLYIQGIFLQAGVKNRNGRIYPPPVLEREVNAYNEKYIKTRKALGELSHPNTPTLNLDKASHMVTEIHREGDNWHGKAKVLTTTPNGIILRGLIKDGYVPGVSSRGLGSLKEDAKMGAKIVQDDYRLMVMIDVVHDPSAPDAVVQGIMENTEWVLNAATGEWQMEMVENLRHDLKEMPKSKLNEREKILAWHRLMRIFAGK